MTIASAVSRVTYTGNGSTATYSYTFRIFLEADLLVTVRNTSGVETTLTLTTDYTVSGEGDAGGGSITLVNASQSWLTAGNLTSGFTISIRRVVDLTQETDIRNQGDFFPESHEDEFDKLTMIDQQQQDEIDRSVKLPESINPANFDASIPADVTDSDSAGKAIVVNADSDGFELSETSYAGTDALFLNDVVYLAFADSPVTVSSSHRGKLLSVDTSGGAVTLNLPAISGLDLAEAFSVSVRKQTSDSNAVTITPNGSETINKSASSKTLVAQTHGVILVPDIDASPDDWQAMAFRDVTCTGTPVGTSDTQVLTNKDYDGGTASNTSRLTVPKASLADISALTRKEGTIIYASDVDKLYKDDGTSLTEIGSGSSGINYIGNPDAESGTTGWATYADTAGTSPVDGTGGSATLSIASSSDTTLRGTKNFLITKDAANRQGEGVSYAFTIDAADKAKVLSVSFDYNVSASFVSGDSSDVRVWVYDVTNSALIPVTPYTIQGGTGFNWSFKGVFQTSSSSTSYRLILHVATTNASAWTMRVDNVVVGPQLQLYGAPVTDWVAFTPTGSWSTATTYTGYRRRVGDEEEFSVLVSNSGSPGTPGALTVNIPVTIDTAKLAAGTGVQPLGYGVANDSGVRQSAVVVEYNSTTSVAVRYDNSNSPTELVALTHAAPNSVGSGDTIALYFKVPVVGYSSTVLMSNDTDTRVVAARYKISGSTGNYSFADNTIEIIDYDTKVFDTHNAVTTGASWKYTVQVPGIYRVRATVNWSSVSNLVSSNIYAYKNGSLYARLGYFVSSVDLITSGGANIQCVPGDTIDIRALQDDSASAARNINVSGDDVYVDIERLSGPSAIAATEKVYLLYTTNGGEALTADVTNTTFSTKVVDSHGAWSGTVFTAPRAGWYEFKGNVSITTTINTDWRLWINGVNKLASIASTGTQSQRTFGPFGYYMNAGDTASFRPSNSCTLSASTTAHWVAISSQG